MIFPFSIYRFLHSPEEHLLELQKKYGDPFPLSFPGMPCIWMTGNSELAKTIFTAPLDSFSASGENPVGPLLGTDGLIMQSGATHLKQRKEFTPFFSKKCVHDYTSTIMNTFFDVFNRHESSSVINIQEFSLNTTLKIILKFLFPHLNPSEMHVAEKLTENFLKSYSASFLFVPKWIPGTWNKFNQNKKLLDNVFYDFFLAGNASGVIGPLNCLEGSPQNFVLDHIRTFIVAGHETTATSLSWALYHLYNDPFLKSRLQEELTIFEDVSNEDYLKLILSNVFLDSIIQESLRIQPPVPFVTRKIINRSFTLGTKTLQINDELGVCISLLHRQNKIWNEPTMFKPGRFTENKYTIYEYAPFGGGARKCIGAELAVLELKILIGFFIKYFHAEIIKQNTPRPEVMQITIGPKNPIFFSTIKRSFY